MEISEGNWQQFVSICCNHKKGQENNWSLEQDWVECKLQIEIATHFLTAPTIIEIEALGTAEIGSCRGKGF